MSPIEQGRRLARQEARVLRIWAAQGRLPRCHALRLPWHDGYVDINYGLDRDELLPDARERPEIRRRA